MCNGHAELCDRSYGNVTFMAGKCDAGLTDVLLLSAIVWDHLAHDSFAFSTNPLAREYEEGHTSNTY